MLSTRMLRISNLCSEMVEELLDSEPIALLLAALARSRVSVEPEPLTSPTDRAKTEALIPLALVIPDIRPAPLDQPDGT